MSSYHSAMAQAIEVEQNVGVLPPRLVGLMVVVICASPLVVGAMLAPSANGMGTHTQMGLPSCGFLQLTGLPCATCGCTTAFAHAAHGSLLSALISQPFGALLALALAMMFWIGLWAAWSGASLAPVWSVLLTKRVVLSWVGLLLAAWAYKAGAVWLAGG